MANPGLEPATFGSEVHSATHYTIGEICKSLFSNYERIVHSYSTEY